jgi:hypothetical protein
VNINNYAVYFVVVQDFFDMNQIALTAYERENTLNTPLNFFISNFDTIEHTKAILKDKDLVEYKVLRENFPNSKILDV